MRQKFTKVERYELVVFESFEHKGQKRHRAFKVGSGVISPHGELVLYIPAGVSVTGRVLVVPEKTPLNEVDLLEAYHSAADAFGV